MSIKSLKLAAREAGERFFDTGFPCKDGHISKRYASNGCCVECLTGKTDKPLNQYQELAGMQFYKPARMLLDGVITQAHLDALDLHLAQCAKAWLDHYKLPSAALGMHISKAIGMNKPYKECT